MRTRCVAKRCPKVTNRKLTTVGPQERLRKRQERLEYFKKLQEYSLEKEDVYVI